MSSPIACQHRAVSAQLRRCINSGMSAAGDVDIPDAPCYKWGRPDVSRTYCCAIPPLAGTWDLCLRPGCRPRMRCSLRLRSNTERVVSANATYVRDYASYQVVPVGDSRRKASCDELQ
ncbi:hypothetical protein OH76DRAFT_890288 [Lentinus brumalis]|uniref:Uncharacterized protein n=1 Tax=Lentinus brumalis TaxID=2498619 RepID=A0A371D114_9APHY|nr:hypothetical protein OH76DRAFT_890288 [Polyporus brumalis]